MIILQNNMIPGAKGHTYYTCRKKYDFRIADNRVTWYNIMGAVEPAGGSGQPRSCDFCFFR